MLLFYNALAFARSQYDTHFSILRLPCEQFESAKILRLLSKQTTSPCEFHCTTFISVVLSTFLILPRQTLRFLGLKVLSLIISKVSKFCYLPRSAASAASHPFEIRNTALRLSFALRATKPCFKTFAFDIAILPFLAGQTQ